mmetsp:Transcript_79654/g.204920  ORF Transcript_79654/g.204920 Transcript_79654/m.204920 type:complete len:239 (-) Transcript_79654:297-1013(-)
MIHIFNCAKGVCSLPGEACKACSQTCKSIGCGPCRAACDAASGFCTSFVEKPLSSYVFIAFALSVCELYQCGYSFKDPALESCVFPEGRGQSVGLKGWLLVQMCFAALTLLFAPYFQTKVWLALMGDLSPPEREPGTKVEARKVQEAFKHVFLNDFGVLFYFFALIASFVWSYQGSQWIQHGANGCGYDANAGWAYWLGEAFFFIALLYTLCWYCCDCCARSVTMPSSGPMATYGNVP